MKMNSLEKRFVNSRRHALGNHKAIERIKDSVDFSRAEDVLEIGCGAGDLTSYLAQTYEVCVTGTDVDQEQITIARERHGGEPNVEYRVADALSLPFADEAFDVVLSFKVLHHIKDWRKAFAEVNRVLRPGGFYVLNDFALPTWACRLLSGVARNSGLYTVDEASNALQENELMPVHKGRPGGILLKHVSFVSRKAS